MKKSKYGVHITHCCILHGCKYGYADCPVYTGKVLQEFICESCDYAGIKTLQTLFDIKAGKIKTCNHCGQPQL